MTRQLAPIFNDCTVTVEAMRQAVKDGSFLQYRKPNSRKHGAIDITSCNNVVRIWDNINETSREKLQRITAGNPGKLAMICWKVTK